MKSPDLNHRPRTTARSRSALQCHANAGRATGGDVRACNAERDRILASEIGTVRKRGSFPVEVALVYPNSYEIGSSNLGFQCVYYTFNSFDEVRCERAFWDSRLIVPGIGGPVSIETGRRLPSFSMLAFSISFEDDYLNVVRTLSSSGIHPLSSERREDEPLVVAGGPCTFMNPEPVAPFIDLFALGDGEVLVPLLVKKWIEVYGGAFAGKSDYLEALSCEEGIYIPRFMDVAYRVSGEVRSFSYRGRGGHRIRPLRSYGHGGDMPRLLSPYAHFSSMPLIEVGSGCSRGCRFCAASFIYRPVRRRGLEEMKRDIDRLISGDCRRIGLVGASISDHPQLVHILEHIVSRGAAAALSSMRLDGIDVEVVRLLRQLGVRSLTCAPEAGSQRMRDVIKKSLTEEDILSAVERIIEGGIRGLKLYFMIGLPFERDTDVEAIVGLLKKVKGIAGRHSPGPRVALKINPFVPKPFTPFQWYPMERRGVLENKIKYLRREIRSIRGIPLKTGSVRESTIQAVLSRGDRRLACVILDVVSSGSSFMLAMRHSGLDGGSYLYRERSAGEVFPWDFIDHDVKREWLYKDYQRAERVASR